MPAFPDELPDPGWKELRVGTPGGMVTMRGAGASPPAASSTSSTVPVVGDPSRASAMATTIRPATQ